MAKVIKKKETSKNLMILYSFPFNFLFPLTFFGNP